MAQIPTRGISAFKSKLIGGGARPNLFEVDVTFPTAVNLGVQGDGTGQFDSENFRFLCKTAALPGSNVTPIEVPFRGRTLKVAGDRTIQPWSVTIINDENFSHRRAFEAWIQNMAQYGDASGLTNPNDYMGNAVVYQLGRSESTQQGTNTTGNDSRILAQYRFIDIFPTSISEIGLSYDSENAIEEFAVDFQVQYYFPEAPGTGA
tara:strand:+ start:2879 stop:3493 length:615 start_codon:yes stop_codon:yes gene_type:complete